MEQQREVRAEDLVMDERHLSEQHQRQVSARQRQRVLADHRVLRIASPPPPASREGAAAVTSTGGRSGRRGP